MSNKAHLVPQAVIDCYESAKRERNDFSRDNYILRLEAIKEYCDRALKELKR